MDEVHPIFKTDPALWYNDIHKKVRITTHEGKSFEGWVYTIDPVTQNYILLTIEESDGDCRVTSATVVMSHAVLQKNVLVEDCNGKTRQCIDSFGRPELPAGEAALSAEALLARKKVLKLWLGRNRLPVVELPSTDGHLVVAGVLTILPPYTPNDCQSNNPIILGRIQGLLKSMPTDIGDDI